MGLLMGRYILGPLELTGRSRSHVIENKDISCVLHRDVVRPFIAMRQAAAKTGVSLDPASGFRDFATQVRIWNAKWTGQRPVHDRSGRPLDVLALRPAARVAAILNWSAPPGGSRHHWGTEIDVYDRTALKAGTRLQLVPEEYEPNGPFAELTAWLDDNMNRWGFYRPYVTDRGGVAPEPWHLSHAPTARDASKRLRIGAIRAAIADGGVLGREPLLKALPTIYARYVRAVDRPPQ
jgi:LAS superfamily LD-carboxypeptidase LdcB